MHTRVPALSMKLIATFCFLATGFALLLLSPAPGNAQWQKIEDLPLPDHHWLDVSFLASDTRFGWICGFAGRVLRTTDGGDSWRLATITGGGQLESISFGSRDVGYCSGPSGMFKSENGGASWFKLALPAAVTSVWGCDFVDEDNGVVAGGGCDGKQYFFSTSSGGAIWDLAVHSTANSGLTDLRLLSAGGTAYAVSSGNLWRSSDGGRSWSIDNSTGSNIWHEELAMAGDLPGSAILLPVAGDDCSGGGDGGGMRFSTDAGASWISSDVGRRMYGAFLLDQESGWACGADRTVYHTVDAGRNWQLRNCGVQEGDLDDIYFIDADEGWLVGEGVYRSLRMPYLFARDTLKFGDVCLPDERAQAIWLYNRSSRPVKASADFGGPDKDEFYLVSPVGELSIGACDSIQIIVGAAPASAGSKGSALRLAFDDGAALRLALVLEAHERSLMPEDSVLLIDPVPVGRFSGVGLRWNQTLDSEEFIEQVEKIDGSDRIYVLENMPFPVPKSTLFNFNIEPVDTGWVEARYRFVIGPCARDTIIRVRAYARSPIIDSESSLTINLACSSDAVDSLTIRNTGNADLVIEDVTLGGLDADDFSLRGWSSGAELPVRIAAGSFDYLLVGMRPGSSDTKTAELTIVNNDSTQSRGPQNPLSVPLNGTALYPVIVADSAKLDFGEFCFDRQKIQREIRLTGDNIVDADLTQIRIVGAGSAFQVDAPVVLPVELPAGTSRVLRLSFEPPVEGDFRDTLLIKVAPCDTLIAIPLEGRARRLFSSLDRREFQIDALPVAAPRKLVTTLRNAGPNREFLVLDSISGNLDVELRVGERTVLNLPDRARLEAASEVALQLAVQSRRIGWDSAQIHLHFEPCNEKHIITVRAFGLSPALETIPSLLIALGHCRESGVRAITINNAGNDTLIIDNAELGGPDPDRFAILGWDNGRELPVAIAPGASAAVDIEFRTTIAEKRESLLRLFHNDRRPDVGLNNPLEIQIGGERGVPVLDETARSLAFDTVCVGSTIKLDLSVINTGNASANIAEPVFRTEHFSVTVADTEFPVRVRNGEPRQFQVQFTPQTGGMIVDTMRLRIEPCDFYDVVLRGFARESRLGADPAFITGDIRSNEDSEFTIEIQSRGNDPAELSSVQLEPLRPEWELFAPDLPLTLLPGDFTTLTVRVNSSDDQALNGRIRLEGLRTCPFGLEVPIDLRSVSSSLRFSRRRFDFGIHYCALEPLREQFDIVNDSDKNLRIDRLVLTGGESAFSFEAPTIPYSMAAGASESIEIVVDLSNTGFFRDTLLLAYDTTVEHIPLAVNITQASISIAPLSVDFGFVPIGSTAEEELVIRSDAAVPVTALVFDDDAAGFSPLQAPAVVGPGATSLLLRYQPGIGGSNRNRLRVVIGEACPQEFFIDLRAASPYALELFTADYIAERADTVSVDIGLRGNLLETPPERIDLTLAFDKWLMAPLHVLNGGDPALPLPLSFDFAAGTATLSLWRQDIERNPVLTSEGGLLVRIPTLALPSVPNSTPLRFSAAHFESLDAEYSVQTFDGSFTVEHFCAPVARALRLLGSFRLALARAGPGNGGIELEVDSDGGMMLSATVSDAYGRRVYYNPAISLHGGRNSLRLRTGPLASGAYYISLSNHLQHATMILPLHR